MVVEERADKPEPPEKSATIDELVETLKAKFTKDAMEYLAGT